MLKQNYPCGIIHQREYPQHEEQAFTEENTQSCFKVVNILEFLLKQ